MESSQLKNIVEAALLAAGRPLNIDQFVALFGDREAPEKKEIREVLKELQADYEGRGIEIREVASGFRVQIRDAMSPWLSKLWEERPPRYSRALMETLAIVAYRQPVTRGDIEEIRGVAVTSNIIRTLLERDWIKVVGHRDVPGKPAMFGTTRGFLDYFGLKKLDDLPPLAELATLEPVSVQLEIEGTNPDAEPSDPNAEPSDEEPQVDGEVQEQAEAAAEADAATDEAVAEQPEAEVAEGELSEDGADLAEIEEEDDDGEPVSDDDIEAASAKIDEIMAALSGKAESEEESEGEAEADSTDVPPGAVAPLVGLNAPGEEPQEPATVSSLDDKRAAAGESQVGADDDEEGLSENAQSAEVVPLKTS